MSVEIEEQYDKIYRYCYFKVHNSTLAEDLTQETFLKYFAQSAYISRGKPLAYLYTIARNLCIDFYRKKQPQELKEEVPQHPMEQVEERLNVELALEQLATELQEIIVLRYTNGLSVKEICEVTGLSRTAEYRREKAALKKLKELLREEEIE